MMISSYDFGGYKAYILENDKLRLKLCELGASVLSLRFMERELCLGYDTAEEYFQSGSCVGAVVGRYANRIGSAAFEIDSERFEVTKNDGENCLHGGDVPLPLHKRLWSGKPVGDNALCFTLESPDGDNGFPGNVELSVCYSIAASTLRIDFGGSTDKPTAFGPTTHMYFDLTGTGSCLDTNVLIAAGSYVEPGAGLIPTGRLLPCDGEFDFSYMRPIACSFDHCFVLNGSPAMICEGAGVRMSIETDYPGIQLYTGDYLDCGLSPRLGFAAEPEFFPDSPNKPAFPYSPLRPGEEFKKFVKYSFEEL